jgi:hypothetical protein
MSRTDCWPDHARGSSRRARRRIGEAPQADIPIWSAACREGNVTRFWPTPRCRQSKRNAGTRQSDPGSPWWIPGDISRISPLLGSRRLLRKKETMLTMQVLKRGDPYMSKRLIDGLWILISIATRIWMKELE